MNTQAQPTADVKAAANDLCRHFQHTGVYQPVEKAKAAAFFSAEYGLQHNIAVPSKLRGVAKRQRLIEDLHNAGDLGYATELDLIEDAGTIFAMHRFRIVGEIASKHLRWLRPLVETGLVKCYCNQVTGGTDGHFFGVNISLHVGSALRELNESARLDWSHSAGETEG